MAGTLTGTTMSYTWFGVFFSLYLYFCPQTQAKASISMESRTSVALAGETLHHDLFLNVPANCSLAVQCFRDGYEIWQQTMAYNSHSMTTTVQASITMQNSSCSGEYYFRYGSQEVHWVVLVRDVGYCEPDKGLESDVIPLLVVTSLLLLFSIIGSVYIFKWHKDHPSSEEGKNKTKDKKRDSTAVTRLEAPNTDSTYMELEPRPVSIYDVLNVDNARRENAERRSIKETAKTSQVEIVEDVYENL